MIIKLKIKDLEQVDKNTIRDFLELSDTLREEFNLEGEKVEFKGSKIIVKSDRIHDIGVCCSDKESNRKTYYYVYMYCKDKKLNDYNWKQANFDFIDSVEVISK